jgi:hypothetical protein
MLKLFCQGAVGFIDWLDLGSWLEHGIANTSAASTTCSEPRRDKGEPMLVISMSAAWATTKGKAHGGNHKSDRIEAKKN